MAHHAEALRAEGAEESLIEAVCRDPEEARLPERARRLVDYALKLTRLDPLPTEGDLEPLRAAGLDDADLLRLVQVVAYFNYVNRHVDGLGVELEPDHPGQRWAELAKRSAGDGI